MERDDDRGLVTEIFLAARNLTPSARPSFLEEACKGDESLRRDVESLLAHDETIVAQATIVDPPPVIPGYRIAQKIGEGGMGEVWLAQQDAPVRRDVAIKVIKAGMDTKQVVARFEAERQALALMEHPSIAKIFAAGETSRGLPYFVMEYVRGEALTAYADRHQLSLDERLALFVEVCEAVQHAHQKGVVHRDLKPSNVLVTLHGRRPTPKIIDFGVAKATAQRLTERSLFTELGTLIGTPEYMSPEQAELTGLDVDARTDVYSLGVILYELLVGTLPFDSRELRAAGFDEIRRRIREDEPPTPSSRLHSLGGAVSVETAHKRRTEPTSLRRQLRGDLDWIAMRALEKDRTRRYQSAADLAAEIERHQRNEPVVAGPPSVGYKFGKFVRRHRSAVAAGLVVTLSAAALVTAAAVWRPRGRVPSKPEPIQKQLTSNPPESAVHHAALSPDGKQLAFADPTGTYLREIQSGETQKLLQAETLDVTSISWFPDGTRLAMTAISPTQRGVSIWTMPIRGGTPRKLRDYAIAGPITPDGLRIAFVNLEMQPQGWIQHGVWVMDVDGGNAREVLPGMTDLDYQSVGWSPDGKAMLFVRAGEPGGVVQGILGVSDLTGAPPRVLVSDPKFASGQCFPNAAWLPDGRILFTRTEPPPNEGSANFWELRIDPTRYTPSGEPTRLTQWADSCIIGVDAPSDGSHLSFLKQHRQSDIYLGELRDNGDRIENVHRLTLDDRDDFGTVWTPDSRAIYFASNRHGTFDIFRQAIDSQTAEAVVQGPGDQRTPRLTPDGLWLLYEAHPVGPNPAPVRLMRMPLLGGSPEVVLEQDVIAGFRCPTRTTASCVLMKSNERELSFFHLDPRSGVGSEIGRSDASSTIWSLSPDGSRIALTGSHGVAGGTTYSGILSMNVRDGSISVSRVEGLDAPEGLAWSADGKSLFMTDFVTSVPSPARRVIHVAPGGHVSELWRSRIVWGHLFNLSPSPDGRYLAFGLENFESNAWMLENF